MSGDDSEHDDAYNRDIIALLQQVGQRLLSHEQDRKILNRTMEEMIERAEQSERAFLTIQDRISKSESIIEKRQKAIEKINREQMERVEKAVAMSEKIEEALAQHNRMNRRLDKVVQDKARMIRKLDRIEEAVLETQDSINTRALAILAEHEQTKSRLPQATASANDDDDFDSPWWKQNMPIRVGMVSAMILLGVAGGLAISAVDNGGFRILTSQNQTNLAYSDIPPEDPPSFTELSDYDPEPEPVTSDDGFSRTVENLLEDDSSETGTTTAAETKSADSTQIAKAEDTQNSPKKQEQPKAKEESPMNMDDEQLLASLNEDPDALAAQLNDITPSAAASIIDEIHGEAEAPNKSVKKAAFTKGSGSKELTTAEFISGQKDSRPLRERIKPDTSLPGVIKEVEAKAYEGIPEAQHDIAAIYTAGHGGVDVNYERAALWFKESAIQGVTNARYNLGVLYHQGLGVKQDINTAVKWYRAAAEGGHPEAQYNLGIAHIEGIGTRYNPEKAAFYFEESAKQGILEAAYNLGLIHENGLTGDSRPDEALYWYKQAADMGSPEAKIAMDQLAKTLGLFPADLERLYSKREEKDKASFSVAEEQEAQMANAVEPATGVQKLNKPAANSGVDYIEAQPLDAGPQVEWNDAPVLSEAPEPAKKPVNTHNVDHAVIAQIQEQLIRVGLYPGPADGVQDTLTEDAIRAYQAHYSLNQDGRASQALLVHMMTSDLGSSTEYGSRPE